MRAGLGAAAKSVLPIMQSIAACWPEGLLFVYILHPAPKFAIQETTARTADANKALHLLPSFPQNINQLSCTGLVLGWDEKCVGYPCARQDI